MKNKIKKWNLILYLPFLFFITIVLFTNFTFTGMAVTNSSYSNYKPSVSDSSYTPPKSDNNYKSPTTGQGYISPETSSFIAPAVGAGYIKPNTVNGSLNITPNTNNVTNTNFTNPVNNNQAGKNNLENNTNQNNINPPPENIPNETPLNQKSEEDLQLVDKWVLWSNGHRYANGTEQFETNNAMTQLYILKDGTWIYGDLHGTWDVSPLKDEDWKRWGIRLFLPTRKITFYGWNGATVDGPIEETRARIELLHIIYFVNNNTKPYYNILKFGHGDRIDNFKHYFLTVKKSGSGQVVSSDRFVNCGDQCFQQYMIDSVAKLKAIPDEGWTFSHWDSAECSKKPSCNIQLDISKTVTAVFTRGCQDSSECSLDQSCENSVCAPINCECGIANNHICTKYACCSNTDCNTKESCNKAVHQCVSTSECTAVIQNGDPIDKHDIVFVGDGFPDSKVLTSGIKIIMDYYGQYHGVFSVKPFSNNKDKFNIWMVNAPDYKYGANGLPDPEDYLRFVKSCDYDTVIVLSTKTYRPYSFFPTSGASGGVIFFSLGFLNIRGADFTMQNAGRMLLHELGHAIGGLFDEYVEYGVGSLDLSKAPNCAPDLKTAEQKWGDLVGINGVDYYTGVKDVPGTKYYKSPNMTVPELGYFPDGSDWSDGGCSYDWKNIRPTINSLMGNQFGSDINYGPVNERVISKKLEAYK